MFQSQMKRIALQIKLSLFAVSDYPTQPVDVVLFHGRAQGDDNDSLFELVVSMYKSGQAKNILINGSNGEKQGHDYGDEKAEKSWAGKSIWIERLLTLGVKRSAIHCFEPAFWTTDESVKMIHYCKKQGWITGVIVAQPHQLLRCISAFIYAMENALDEKYMMKVYSSCPRSVDWFEKCAGSQGLYDMPRHDHIGLEYNKIQTYLFNMATLKQVLEYYRSRNSTA
jgi:hypothetical protein